MSPIKKQICFPTTHPKSFRPIQHYACNGMYQCFTNFFPWTNRYIIFHIPKNAYYGNVHRSEVVQGMIAIQLPLHYFHKIYVRKDDTYMHVCVRAWVCSARQSYGALYVAREDYSSTCHCQTKKFRRQLKGHFGFSAVFQDVYLFIPRLLTEPLSV
jgi:hypothetical protein